MAASGDSESAFFIIDRAIALIEREGGFSEFIQNAGLGGISLAFIVNIIEGINSIGGIFIQIPLSIVGGFVGIFDAAFGGFVDILEASTATAVTSFSEGTTAILGPAAPIAGIIVVGVSVYVLLEFVQRIDFSPLAWFTGRFGR